ncbi:MAG: hypothetical protein LBT27_05745 [Prevotellaceae bacterium]|jgi:hypothetical protein|nr:hypothetical protein [Prevotellaceae bacterium]
MKKIFFLLFFIPFVCFAQKPSWVTDMVRNNDYPKEQYLTSFVSNVGAESPAFINALKASAKSELIEGIIISVQSTKYLAKSEIKGVVSEEYTAVSLSFADATINGLHTEYYYDKSAHTGYCFAYADKNKIKDYYKTNISFIIQKIEMTIENAKQFEDDGNKGRARKTYESATPFFDELNVDQFLLIAIEGNENESAQMQKTLALKAEIIQSVSWLQTAIAIYVQAKEKNFEQTVHLLEPKIKAELSKYGCSFVPTRENADWMLVINAQTRKGSVVEGIYFSYLDATISLVEKKSGKEIYNNNFTDIKGGGLDYDKAGRKAYDSGLKKIADEIIINIEK